ncbi:acyl-CoA dehydrogenase family protein [Paraburkholderia sp. BL21I4N1]|uniref:acyl-CoA dehydrogenase family protein n=1 Tax=Paraburkholderia sp. BL21I4N1 TaxID=1938801 RepID=UPI000CFCB897|nr:acyl-CoA dehydrogenase family protein [Paraburkholderia sp. BL21I4N1]PQV54846.1 alkylation response protein AidB-like acyl-CoA dehydrogenase [Paraburkholderia sp. BL21I4N1]
MTARQPLVSTLVDGWIDRAAALGRDFDLLAAYHDRTGAAPAAQFDALQKADLLRLVVAQADGGHGAGLAAASAVVREIAYGDPSVALILSMHYSQHAGIVRSEREGLGEWPAHLARRLAREAATGAALFNAAQVEPGLGSPSHGGLPDTLARREGEYWRISGHKLYVTGSPLLSWISVLARTDEAEPRLGQFLIPRSAPGVRIVETWDPLGMRATVSHDVVFTDVAVPLPDVVALKPASLGLQRHPHSTAWYFTLVGCVYDGAARAARDWLVRFLNERRPGSLGGASLASLATVQQSVGAIEVLLQTNDWLLKSSSAAFDDGTAPDTLASTVKQVVVDNAIKAVDLALELTGNHGLARGNPLERHHRNVLCSQIHAPSNSLLSGNAGRAVLQARK